MVTFWGTAGAFMTKLVKQCEADQIVPTEVAVQEPVKVG
jgi:hypothetical protein